MAYIGAKPTNVPLTSDQLSDNIITSSKIVDGAITSSDLTTSGVTAGSYTNASVTVNDKGIITAASSGAGVSTTYGAIGTYVMAFVASAATPGTTIAGSSLVYRSDNSRGGFNSLGAASADSSSTYYGAIASANGVASLGLSGTWRFLTYASNSGGGYAGALFVRVS